MKVYIGKSKFDSKAIIWDTEKVINGHMLIVGGSGAGKTYTIRQILKVMQKEAKKAKVSIMDVHGDIEIEGMERIAFSEVSPYGLNPLVINADVDFGGVRRRVETFKSIINSAGKLGVQQEQVIQNAIEDLCAAQGFLKKDPTTWDINVDKRKNPKFPKRYPTLEDLIMFLTYKMKQMKFGTTDQVVNLLEQLNRQKKKLQVLMKKSMKAQGEDEIAKIESDIEKTKASAKELFSEYMDAIATGREVDEMLRYENADVISSTLIRLRNMEQSGIFKNKHPDFKPDTRIQNYDIKSLSGDEQRYFVYTLLEEKFMYYKSMGALNDSEDRIREIIVMDEAHIFVNDDPRNPINTILKEARKYGLAIIFASQSFNHFSEDILSNVVTKLCLGIDETFHDPSARALKIDAKRFKHIVMQKTGLVQIKEKGSTSNQFLDVILNVGEV